MPFGVNFFAEQVAISSAIAGGVQIVDFAGRMASPGLQDGGLYSLDLIGITVVLYVTCIVYSAVTVASPSAYVAIDFVDNIVYAAIFIWLAIASRGFLRAVIRAVRITHSVETRIKMGSKFALFAVAVTVGLASVTVQAAADATLMAANTPKTYDPSLQFGSASVLVALWLTCGLALVLFRLPARTKTSNKSSSHRGGGVGGVHAHHANGNAVGPAATSYVLATTSSASGSASARNMHVNGGGQESHGEELSEAAAAERTKGALP